MAKKEYTKAWMGLTPEDDDPIPLPPSQGTSGDDSQFTWDPAIDQNDIDMFWISGHDETDLAYIDTDDDLFISSEEFMAWYESEQPW